MTDIKVDTRADTRVFKLTNFAPVGFKVPNYPVKICLLCRGLLVEVCHNCMEKGDEKCSVTNQEGSYFHTHCLAFMNTTKPETKKKKYASSGDEF